MHRRRGWGTRARRPRCRGPPRRCRLQRPDRRPRRRRLLPPCRRHKRRGPKARTQGPDRRRDRGAVTPASRIRGVNGRTSANAERENRQRRQPPERARPSSRRNRRGPARGAISAQRGACARGSPSSGHAVIVARQSASCGTRSPTAVAHKTRTARRTDATRRSSCHDSRIVPRVARPSCSGASAERRQRRRRSS